MSLWVVGGGVVGWWVCELVGCWVLLLRAVSWVVKGCSGWSSWLVGLWVCELLGVEWLVGGFVSLWGVGCCC